MPSHPTSPASTAADPSAARQPGRVAAFFDLDRTLIDANSGLLYARWERKAGRIHRRQLAKSLVWGALYHFDLIDLDKAYSEALSHYVGVPEAALRERTHDWFHADVAHRLRPGGQAALDKHRQAGHPCVLLTNSSCYAAEAAAAHWGLDGWLANHFSTDGEGRLDGRFEPPLCYGAGKVARAEAWAAAHDVDLDASWFYTDALSDLPMLERVAHPIVVHPDPRLRRAARARGWPVETW